MLELEQRLELGHDVAVLAVGQVNAKPGVERRSRSARMQNQRAVGDGLARPLAADRPARP